MSSSVDYSRASTAPAEAVSTGPLDSVAERPALVTGRVRRSDGVALAGAGMTVIDTAGRQCGLGRTDADGRYRCPVPGPASTWWSAPTRRTGRTRCGSSPTRRARPVTW
jgi:hypothetical protein